jgi:hypothetical protein
MANPKFSCSLIVFLALLLTSSQCRSQGTYTNPVGGFAMKYDALKYTLVVGWNETFFKLMQRNHIYLEGTSFRINPINNYLYPFKPHGSRSDSLCVVGIYQARCGCSSDGDSGSTDCPEPDSVSTYTSVSGLTVFKFHLKFVVNKNGTKKSSPIGPFYVLDISKDERTRGLLISFAPDELATPAQEKELDNLVHSVSVF